MENRRLSVGIFGHYISLGEAFFKNAPLKFSTGRQSSLMAQKMAGFINGFGGDRH